MTSISSRQSAHMGEVLVFFSVIIEGQSIVVYVRPHVRCQTR